ncbi:MAG: ABC transporter ATP-binding protein [Lachnospiraceae bacterium]
MSLQVKNLNFSYKCWKVLQGVDFTLESGQLICVLGKNGAGKSTLFRCILGMLKGYTGEIRLNNKNIKDYSISEIARNIAYIPQKHQAVYDYTVLDMVLMGTTSAISRFGVPGKEQKQSALEALEMVDMLHYKERNFSHISGGEQQMVLIARAIAQKAKIIIMDEPCASLDYGNQVRIMHMSKELVKKGYLIVQSTHSPEQVFLYADQVMVLRNGKIAEFGQPNEVLTEEVLERIYGIGVTIYGYGTRGMKVCVPMKRED